MTASSARTAGIAALVLAGLADILVVILTYAVGAPGDSAPPAVMITVLVAGLVSLVALRGTRGSLIAAYVARLVSIALGVPAWFLGAPAYVDILVAIALVLSVAGVWLTLPGLRRPVAVRT
jgi:hypothetical protein